MNPHEDVKAAIGLEVARDIGHHLVAPRQLAVARKRDRHVRRGAHDIGIDALVDHVDSRLVNIGELRLLPGRGGHTQIGRLEGRQMVCGADTGTADGVETVAELWVEAHVRPTAAIVELAIRDQRDIGEHVLEKQRLAPAGMADHHIGNEPLALERQRRPRRALPVDHRGLGAAEIVVDALGDLAVRFVLDLGHIGHRRLLGLRDEDHLFAVARGQAAQDMAELRRKILMDEKRSHALSIPDHGRQGNRPERHPAAKLSLGGSGATGQCPVD